MIKGDALCEIIRCKQKNMIAPDIDIYNGIDIILYAIMPIMKGITTFKIGILARVFRIINKA